MSTNTALIRGRVVNDKRIAAALAFMPERFRKTLLGWLLRERDSFVGSKTKDGVFRKSLMRKRNMAGGTWDKRVARAFRGIVENDSQVSGMRLRMGAGIRGERPFVKGLRILGEGGDITSSKFMPIPVYKNISNTHALYKRFREMNAAGALEALRIKGQVIWFDRNKLESIHGTSGDLASATLFIGAKRIRVKKQFDFDGSWERRVPSALQRGQKAVDKAVSRIEGEP